MDEGWLKVQIELAREDLAHGEAVCEELGAAVTWTEDAGSAPVLEPAPGATPLWPRLRLTTLLPASIDPARVTAALAAALPAGPAPAYSLVADRDWDADFRRGLKPMRFGRRTWICPGDARVGDAGAVSVLLEPGLAFGTGTHATTALCLAWLDGLPLAGNRVLDYGCGSGILGIAALAHGAARVTAVDLDPQALTATRANGERNGCAGRLSVRTPGEFRAEAAYDVIVANILSGILLSLEPVLRQCAGPGSRLGLSGILVDQAAEVMAAYASWIELRLADARDDWVLLTGQRPG